MTDDTERLGRSAHTPQPVGHDDPGWMAMFSVLDDRQVDDLLAGLPPADAELAPIAELAAALRRRAAAEPVPAMSTMLREQLSGPAVVALAARRAGRGALIKAGAVAAAAASVVALGVGASQNRLPSGLQDVVSSTAGLVGIEVPTSNERGRSEDAPGQGDTTPGNDGEPGLEGTTPGGATPADPGTPGDHEPATPATTPEQSHATPGTNQGNDDPGTPPEQSNDVGGDSGGEVTPTTPVAPPPAEEPTPAETPTTVDEPAGDEHPGAAHANENGAANGSGFEQASGPPADAGNGNAETHSAAHGQAVAFDGAGDGAGPPAEGGNPSGDTA